MIHVIYTSEVQNYQFSNTVFREKSRRNLYCHNATEKHVPIINFVPECRMNLEPTFIDKSKMTTLFFIFCFVEIAVPKKNNTTQQLSHFFFFGKVILSVFAILPSTCNFPAMGLSSRTTIQPAKIEDEHKFSLCLCFVHHACIV